MTRGNKQARADQQARPIQPFNSHRFDSRNHCVTAAPVRLLRDVSKGTTVQFEQAHYVVKQVAYVELSERILQQLGYDSRQRFEHDWTQRRYRKLQEGECVRMLILEKQRPGEGSHRPLENAAIVTSR